MMSGNKAVLRAGVGLAVMALMAVLAPLSGIDPTASPAAALPVSIAHSAPTHAPSPAPTGVVSTQAQRQLPAPLPQRGRVFRLYQAVFLRPPDVGGLTHWETRHFLAGSSLYAIADRFVTSDEFQRRYGSLDDTQFVRLVYRNVLDREPEPGGAAYWRSRLATGLTRGELMVGFSESSEFIRTTRTDIDHLVAPLPSLAPGSLPHHDDWLGWLNLHRTGAGLGPVTENPDWSAGAQAHAHYAVAHQDLSHSQDPESPLFTPEGDEAARSANLLGSGTQMTAQQAIESWLNSPSHGAWLVNPRWESTGYGEFHDPMGGALRWAGVLDVVRGTSGAGGSPSLRHFPADGQAVRYRPQRAFVIFPLPIITSALTASASINSEPIPVSVSLTSYGGYPTNTAVVTLSRRPDTGDEVTISVAAGSQSTTWRFEVGFHPPVAPLVSSSATTPSGLVALHLAPAPGQRPEEVTHTLIELWDRHTMLERQVLDGPEARTAFLHAGPPKQGVEVRVFSQGPAGRSTPRILRY